MNFGSFRTLHPYRKREKTRSHYLIRWGDIVFEVDNYDNDQNVFAGIGKNGDQLPSGVYFYKIDFKGQRESISGYLNLKR